MTVTCNQMNKPGNPVKSVAVARKIRAICSGEFCGSVRVVSAGEIRAIRNSKWQIPRNANSS